ncbi:uncharacterized protein [Typha angustifolia]|uniref:uncharacterized protein isoform X1 n=2 Tax=Typha angustifolia TaxID=59011 RepID=UPI003C2FDE5C
MEEATNRSEKEGLRCEGSKQEDPGRGGVEVSSFDYSVENFFSMCGEIAALCGESNEPSFEAGEIKRFASMITFLKEWKHFYYEPKIISFSHDTACGQVKDLNSEICLPQFSSAAVPEIEKSPDKLKCSDSTDFVLHAGGDVWAMDWCPRMQDNHESTISCEYLAVAAHSPGSTYHKIGAPLTGRGAIQIWCLVTLVDKVDVQPAKHRAKTRPKKELVREEPGDGLNVVEMPTSRPRGRPRKVPVQDNSLGSLSVGGLPDLLQHRGTSTKRPILSSTDVKESSSKRPRGRPRKSLPPSVEDLIGKEEESSLCHNSQVPLVSDFVLPLSVDSGEVAVALPVSSIVDAKESTPKQRRGRPRKKAVDSRKDCSIASAVELQKNTCILPISSGVNNTESSKQRRRGRPSKKLAPSRNGCSSAFGAELGKDESEQLISADVSCVEPIQQRHRGRPRKNPILSNNSCIVSPDIELGKVTSIPSILSGCSTSHIENVNESIIPVNLALADCALPSCPSPDINCTERSTQRRSRGRPRKKPASSENNSCISSGVEFEKVVSPVPILNVNEPSIVNRSSVGCQADQARTAANCNASSQFLSVVNENGLSVKFVPGSGQNSAPVIYQAGDEGLIANKQKWGLENKEVENSCNNSTCPILHTEDKILSVTIAPHDNACQDETLLNDKMSQKVPHQVEFTSPVIPKNIALPRVMLCLAHNGKVAWDVKWKPYVVNKSECKHHMGYLAVLLGSGTLEVWEVPLPSMVQNIYSSTCGEGIDPRFLKLQPIFRCSKVKCGSRQSVPLTVEWSPHPPHNMILAGCHDGMVALWKFSPDLPSQDSKPLICFSADSVPIRALSWAPYESDGESSNLFVTGGHEGLKFWDIRDPYRPLWDLNPSQRAVLSLDWLKEPRCLIISFDDGTLKILGLSKAASDVPVTGRPFVGAKHQGLLNYPCSAFAIWSVHVSRTTGLVAYCSADGLAIRFQLTAKFVDKGSSRNRVPHILCGSLIDEGQSLKINTPLPKTPLQNVPVQLKKVPNHCGDVFQPMHGQSLYIDESKVANPTDPGDDRSLILVSDNAHAPPLKKTEPKPRDSKEDKLNLSRAPVQQCGVDREITRSSDSRDEGSAQDVFPPKVVAMHRVRWNMNKGRDRWLCYGGSAGIIRCQKISSETC